MFSLASTETRFKQPQVLFSRINCKDCQSVATLGRLGGLGLSSFFFCWPCSPHYGIVWWREWLAHVRLSSLHTLTWVFDHVIYLCVMCAPPYPGLHLKHLSSARAFVPLTPWRPRPQRRSPHWFTMCHFIIAPACFWFAPSLSLSLFSSRFSYLAALTFLIPSPWSVFMPHCAQACYLEPPYLFIYIYILACLISYSKISSLIDVTFSVSLSLLYLSPLFNFFLKMKFPRVSTTIPSTCVCVFLFVSDAGSLECAPSSP